MRRERTAFLTTSGSVPSLANRIWKGGWKWRDLDFGKAGFGERVASVASCGDDASFTTNTFLLYIFQ